MDAENKETKPKPAPDPHTEMMKQFRQFQAAAQKYCDGIGIKHIRIVGDALNLDAKMEFSQH